MLGPRGSRPHLLYTLEGQNIMRFAPRAAVGLALTCACWVFTLVAVAQADDVASIDPTPRSRQQALFDRINVAEAWQITQGDPTTVIGVVDSGYDYYHPDLKGQLIPGYYYPGGYHTEFYENIVHGTLVAGIMVAKGTSPDALIGLAPRCRLLTASQGTIEHLLLKLQRKVAQEHPNVSSEDFQKELQKAISSGGKDLADFGLAWVRFQLENAADAIRYLVDHDAKVINISGFIEHSTCPIPAVWQKIEEAFAYAARNSVVVVLGAGNNATRIEGYPGQSDTVIVVGASLLNDSRWEQELDFGGQKVVQGSSFGRRLTVMAPVEKLLVCVPHEPRVYASDDGPFGATRVKFEGIHKLLPVGATSSAAPIVASLVALIYSARPELDAKSVVEIVKRGCDDIGAEGYDLQTGYGRVNFGKSLKLAQSWNR